MEIIRRDPGRLGPQLQLVRHGSNLLEMERSAREDLELGFCD